VKCSSFVPVPPSRRTGRLAELTCRKLRRKTAFGKLRLENLQFELTVAVNVSANTGAKTAMCSRCAKTAANTQGAKTGSANTGVRSQCANTGMCVFAVRKQGVRSQCENRCSRCENRRTVGRRPYGRNFFFFPDFWKNVPRAVLMIRELTKRENSHR
jgi:hypothetical protein